jgi:hypothetical protein
MPNPKTVRDLESRTAREKEMAAGPSVPEPDDKHGSTAQVATSRSDAGGSIQIADRIKELRRVRARDLLPNPKNWRRHPKAQIDALRGLLAEVGYADALLVRQLPDGRLMLIDGHLRAETTPMCWCLCCCSTSPRRRRTRSC